MNFFNILIITGVFHGLIFSAIVLMIEKYHSKSSIHLSIVVLSLSLHNLYYWFHDVGLSDGIPYYDYLYVPWNLLILPMYYLFVQTYFQKRKKTNQYFFLPFCLCLLTHFYLFINAFINNTPFTSYKKFVNIFYNTEEYLSLLFTVFVIIKTFYLIRINKKQVLISRNNLQIETKWLEKVLYFGILICLFWLFLIIYSQLNQTGQLNTNLRYFVWVAISILIYWLGYLGVHHGIVYSERKHLKSRMEDVMPIISNNNISKIDNIKNKIEHEKLFLDPNFGLSLVSEKFSINENYFSSIFNKISTDNFSTYLYKLRVKEAEILLLNKKYKNYTIFSICLESGFNSKSNFYKAFKEETGMSPSQYRKINMS